MITRRILLAIALVVCAGSLRAQDTHVKMDMGALAKTGEQLFNPASFALSHRKELSLTDQQVAALDSIAAMPHQNLMEMAHLSAEETALNLMLFDSSVPLDEDVIRKGVQARVARETESALARARADRKVNAVLTPFQRIAFRNMRFSSMADIFTKASSVSH